ncbi:TetR/AcrR family transcriptional regulator [Undibacterium sp. SXout7W]|uniref:TetR/AcrR family transcriptional regulator n=1 Tax=Undibacterium sp. SXout7W TaxID=3413049 RepID=UPI003BF2F08D
MMKSDSPLKLRRKPVQQRSKMTQASILDAFVRLLVEKTYTKLTMRDIALVAGVGLGTLYEYFPGKKSIAAHCIHERFKNIGTSMQMWIEELRGLPVIQMTDILIDRIIGLHAREAEEWSALILLERQISDIQSYRSLYAHIVSIWGQAIEAGCDAALYAGKSAEVVHAAVYGLLYQRLMLLPHSLSDEEFQQNVKTLVLGYLQLPADQCK